MDRVSHNRFGQGMPRRLLIVALISFLGGFIFIGPALAGCRDDGGPPTLDWVRYGGAEDNFGGGGDVIGMLLAAVGFVTIPDAVLPDTGGVVEISRNIPYSSESPIERVIVDLTKPDGTTETYRLFPGMPVSYVDGLVLSLFQHQNGEVPYYKVEICVPLEGENSWPAGTKISYRAQSASGDSNSRSESVRRGSGDRSLPRMGQGIDPKDGEQISFELMFSYYAEGLLTRIDGGGCEIYVDDVLQSLLVIENGFLTVPITVNQETKLVLWAYEFFPITLRFEFNDGILTIYKEPEGEYQTDSPVTYYQEPEGNYTIEYYRNRLYICNQGDAEGPIMGGLHEPSP